MKRLAIVVIVLAILGGIAYFYSSVEEYTAPEVVEKEVPVEVDTLQKRINDAKAAEEMNIEAKAYKAYLESREQQEKEVELKVTNEYKKEIDAHIQKLEKEVSL